VQKWREKRTNSAKQRILTYDILMHMLLIQCKKAQKWAKFSTFSTLRDKILKKLTEKNSKEKTIIGEEKTCKDYKLL